MAQTSQVFKRELSFLTVEFSFKLHIVLFHFKCTLLNHVEQLIQIHMYMHVFAIYKKQSWV